MKFGNEDPKLQFGVIESLISKKLDPFETKRLADKLQIRKDVLISYEDTVDAFRALLEEDLDDVIE